MIPFSTITEIFQEKKVLPSDGLVREMRRDGAAPSNKDTWPFATGAPQAYVVNVAD